MPSNVPRKPKHIFNRVPQFFLVLVPRVDPTTFGKSFVDDDGDALKLRFLHEAQVSWVLDDVRETLCDVGGTSEQRRERSAPASYSGI